MVGTEKLFIINENIELEAEYFQSKSDTTSAMVVCHPHPQFGGSLWNNVVSGVFNKCIKSDVSSLRFNFRAVGNSTGDHGGGEEERTDVKACIKFLTEEKSNDKIFICGYSYGAAIGCSVVNFSENIIGYASIAFPWAFMGSFFKEKAQTDKPKLFIQGDRDNIAHYSHFDENYNFYKEPKKFEIIKGADHFYGGREGKVADLVLDFYKSLIS
jgi:alpha/beta superfamily hydrolase